MVPGAKRREPLARSASNCLATQGGHNGLVAAGYLARAGRSVLVLERLDRTGGAA
ncbi:NAD(P)-binding protein, partial [Streptomyces sp. NPDC021722]|uniref:NAD(P)-binding protein n=1 Tax=Streptomyces sp. NPDC021722 TaxID=3154904 RepID=UPI00340B276C